MNTELYERITQKKEFSQLPKKDVELAIEKFEKRNLNDYQMLKLTRQFLRKIYSSFSSRKVFSSDGKGKSTEWYLMKHKSSKERFPHYEEVYERIFPETGKFSVVDLGCGINGLSFLPSTNPPTNSQPDFIISNLKIVKVNLLAHPNNLAGDLFSRIINYLGIEAIGQFVDLMNEFFKKEKFNGKAIHESLFDMEKIKEIIKEQKKPRIILLLKVIDSLEIVQRDYSKKLLEEITPLGEKIVVSFATRSLGNRKKFSANRNWLNKCINKIFKVEDDFEIGGERYIVFKK